MMIDSTGYTLEQQGLTLSKGLKGSKGFNLRY